MIQSRDTSLTGKSVKNIWQCALTLGIPQHQQDNNDQNLTNTKLDIATCVFGEDPTITQAKFLVEISMNLEKQQYPPQDSPIKQHGN